MIRQKKNISAIVTLSLSFAGVAGLAGYVGHSVGSENAYYYGFQDGLDSYAEILRLEGEAQLACDEAEIQAGQTLGDYILGENAVSEAVLDTAEVRASELCANIN